MSRGFGSGQGRGERIIPRTGLPVKKVLPRGKCSEESAKETKIRSTNRPRIRLLRPGKVFCSWMAVGYPMAQAVKTTGPEEYPPTPKTISGLKEQSKFPDWIRLCGIAIRLRSLPQNDFPFTLATWMVLKATPSLAAILASNPWGLPTKRISFAGSRSLKTSATARAGKRCPPVPPPAIMILIGYSHGAGRNVQENSYGH